MDSSHQPHADASSTDDAEHLQTYAEHAARRARADGGHDERTLGGIDDAPPHADLCDLCREQPVEHEGVTVFDDGPTIGLDVCLGCRIHVEDSGRVVEPEQEIDSDVLDLKVDPAGIHLDGTTLTPREAARLGSTLSVAAHLDLDEWTEVDR